MQIHKSVTLKRLVAVVEADDYLGLCLACGEEQGGCEPDARKYTCESCGKDQVYGAEELLMNVSCYDASKPLTFHEEEA